MHALRAQALTEREAAEILGCSVQSIRRMRASGQLPWFRIGARGVRIPRHAVEALVYGNAQETIRQETN